MVRFEDYQAFQAREDWYGLIRLARSEISRDINNVDAYVFLALSYEKQGYGLSALKLLSNAVQSGVERRRLHGFRIQILINIVRWTEALTEAWEHIEEFPDDVWGYRHAIELLTRLNAPERAVAVGPLAAARLNASEMELLAKPLAEARRAADTMPDLTSWEMRTVASLEETALLESAEDADAVEAELWRRYHTSGISERLLQALKRLYFRPDRSRLDMQAFLRREAVRLWPERADALAELAGMCLRIGWYEESEDLARRALAIDPGHADSLISLLRVLDLTGRTDEEWELLRCAQRSLAISEPLRGLISLRIQNGIAVTPRSFVEVGLRDHSVPAPEWHVPAPRRPSPPKRQRLALCISGQLRGFREAWQSLQPLRDEFDVDVFVHTWQDVGAIASETAKEEALRAAIGEIEPSALQHHSLTRAQYPNCFGLADKISITEDMVREFYSAKSVVVESSSEFEAKLTHRWADLNLPQPSVNCCKMLYKINACGNLVRKAIAEGHGYDYVMRVRPDLKIYIDTSVLSCNQFDDSMVLGSYVLGGDYHGFSDQLAVGSPTAMDVYASIWPRIWEVGSGAYAPHFPTHLMENIVFHHLFASGVRMRVDKRLRGEEILRTPSILPEMLRDVFHRDV